MLWAGFKCQKMTNDHALPKSCRTKLSAAQADTRTRNGIDDVQFAEISENDEWLKSKEELRGGRATSSAVDTHSTCTGISWHSHFRDQQRRRSRWNPRRCHSVGVVGHRGYRRRTSSFLQSQTPEWCSDLFQSSLPGNARCRPYTHHCRYLESSLHQCHYHLCRTGDDHRQRTPAHTGEPVQRDRLSNQLNNRETQQFSFTYN